MSVTDPSLRYAGESELMEVLPGEKTVHLEPKLVGAEPEEDTPSPKPEEGEKEEPSIVNAATPTIATQPEGETRTFAAGQVTAVKKELTVKASVSDGGSLTYQWYSNDTNSTEGGTAIEGARSSSYEATVNAKETKYFYCVIINTNNSVTGAKTAATITSVVAVASVEGELTSINATYKGEYLLVGVTPTNFTVTENYSGGKSVEISPIDGLYTVEVPENSIGNVPVTIKSTKDDSIQTQVPVQIKYELDVNNLTITGGDTVTQNGNLVLTAQYKTVDGADVEYKLYDGSGSSNTYKVIENVRISWEGDVQQSSTWEALADTATAGLKTATVKLISTDEWCVTTDGIEKSEEFKAEPSGELGSQTNPVTTWSELAEAVADSATSTIYVDAATMTAESGITFNGNKQIIPLQDLTITGTLTRTSLGITDSQASPPSLFLIGQDSDVSLGSDSYTITLKNISFTDGMLIYSYGTLSMTNVSVEGCTSYAPLVLQGATTSLNKVSFSKNNTQTDASMPDIAMSETTTLKIGQNIVIERGISFSVFPSNAGNQGSPQIQLDENSSCSGGSADSKVVIIVVHENEQGIISPDYLQIVSVGDYAGDPNDLFEVVGNDGAIYTLDDEGRLVAADDSTGQENPPSQEPGTTIPDAGVVSGELGSQTNPVTTWAELSSAVANSATSKIYVKATTMTAESGITFNGDKEIIPLQNLTITGTLSDSCLFDVRDYAVSLGSDAHTITLDGISTRETIISISGTLSMTNVSVENCSGGGYLVYQGAGATCLNNVSFSGNKPNDCIDLHSSDTENNTLEIGQDVAIGGIYIAVYDGAVAPPLVKLNAASSLRAGSSKITLTVQSSSPVGLQIVSVGDYAGNPNDLFEVVGNDGAIYTLDDEGRLVAADDSTGQENPPSQEPGTTTPEGELGSQTNPVITWTDLQNLIENGTNPIYISGAMDASETIMVTDAAVELISVGNTTITRNSLLSDELFWSEQSLTFIGSDDAPIIFDGNSINSIEANASMISAEADLTMTYCTMQNNVNTSNSGGGAILVNSGTLTLNNCHFSGNTSNSGGGAILVNSGTLTLNTCHFSGNTSTSGGGAILVNSGTLTLNDCQFIGNKTDGDSSPGGAIYMTPPGGDKNTNKLIATGTLFQSNATGGKYSNGGAISFENTTETNILDNCYFSSNSVSNTGRGAGIYVSGQAKVRVNGVTMESNTISPQEGSTDNGTPEDIRLLYDGHLTLAGVLKIPALIWDRSTADTYTEVLTAESSSEPFVGNGSSIGLKIVGTMFSSSLELFVANSSLTSEQISSFTITDESGSSYTLSEDGVINKQ